MRKLLAVPPGIALKIESLKRQTKFVQDDILKQYYKMPSTAVAIGALSINMILFVLRFYGPVNPMGSCRAWSVYLTTPLLGRLSPLTG